jgi:hypothetical protein
MRWDVANLLLVMLCLERVLQSIKICKDKKMHVGYNYWASNSPQKTERLPCGVYPFNLKSAGANSLQVDLLASGLPGR